MPTFPSVAGGASVSVLVTSVLAAGLIAAGLGLAQPAAAADTYPVKPIKVLIPLSAGSAADLVPRIVYDEVSRSIGQPIVLENRVGAGGTIAANMVAKSDPDGYTMVATSSAMTSAHVFIKQVPYDVLTDLAGVAPFGIQPNLLVIATSQGIKSLQELVQAARTRPEGLTYGAVVGTPIHLNAEHFRQTMHLNAKPVAFRGAPEALTEVLTSRVDYYFAPLTLGMQFVNDGKMVGLAVTSAKRSTLLPNVPTTFEQGYPDSEFGLWFGAWVPAKTPPAIIERLNAEITKALDKPAVQAKFKEMAVEPLRMSVSEFNSFVKREIETNTAIAKAAGIASQ